MIEQADGRRDERKTILVVDDTKENLTVLAALLGAEFRVRVANSGERALKSVHMAPVPDLILLDVMMPDMDGYAVLKALCDDPVTRDIPVIFVTAMSADEDEEFGLGLGAVDYVTKPIRAAILLARVRTHLELKRARDVLAALSPFDIGQAAVVIDGHVVAVEDIEGTDGLLARVARLRGEGRIRARAPRGVLVKAPKSGQDLRFDLPTIGPRTVERAVEAGLSGIAIVAGHTIVVEPQAMIAAADAAGLFVTGLPA